jgi:hypothetical protein
VTDLPACDPATVPEWAREHTARLVREHPESVASWLEHVAVVETARQRTAAHPPGRPALPQDPRDFLHLLAIRAWRALASGQPAPGVDLVVLATEISAVFGGDSPVDQLCDDWLNAAREHGIAVDGEDGEILDGIIETIMPVITAAFWSGLTTGHYTIAGRNFLTPRRFMPYFERAATGSRG